MENTFNDLQSTVIQRGLCTACGTCSGLCPAGAIGWADDDGEPLPVLAGACSGCGVCGSVCPGADVDLPALERFIFGRERKEEVPDLGLYQDACAAWAAYQDTRRRGAGGGLVTALLVFALEQGLIDCALVAGFKPGRPYRTEALLAAGRAEIQAAAQSKYACVTVNSLLRQALDQGYRRIAVVGLPCQVHGLRKMQYLGSSVFPAESLAFIIGLYCASQFYFEGTRHLLVEQMQVPDMEEITGFSYRGGAWPGHMVADLKDGRRFTLDRHQYMYHHLMPAFKRDRCEMCVDWSSELADLSVGDYWNPKSRAGENPGMSSCLIRTDRGRDILAAAVKSGYVQTGSLEPSHLATGVGYELKKHAAAFRLKQRRRFGWPIPDYHRDTDYTPFAREQHLAPESK